MTDSLRVDALLARGIDHLRHAPAAQLPGATPALDAELLLIHVLRTSRTRLRSHPEECATSAQARSYEDLVQRRASGEPLAYITGTKDFWSLELSVSPAVLVPRPETELLVERALALRPEMEGRVVDLGTGSGAIALALATERPLWQITATDLSAPALAVAHANAAALRLERVELVQGRWLEPLKGRIFDLIVSNPPYLGEDDPALDDAALRHEPRDALTPEGDGFASLREIIDSAPQHLERGGWLLLEHGYTQGPQVLRELVGRGFRHVTSQRDLAGHERVTEGQWHSRRFG